jgi:putative ABC transport system permease protein
MSQAWQDLRYAVRVLVKTPVVTAVAIVSLGIGANTTIFSILNALFLRSLPVSTISPDGQNGKDPLLLPMFQEIRQRQQAFSGMFAWSGGCMSNFEANGVKYAAGLDTVTGDYFSTLGAVNTNPQFDQTGTQVNGQLGQIISDYLPRQVQLVLKLYTSKP